MGSLRVIIITLFAIGLVSCEPDGQRVFTPEGDNVIAFVATNLSGMCYNADKTAFLCAIDKGAIWEVSTNGAAKRQITLSGIASGANADFEGITISPDGTIYVAVEGNKTNPNNDCVYIFDATFTKTGQIPIPIDGRTDSGNGIEGITYGGGILYITNQGHPAQLIKYDISREQIISSKTLTGFFYLSDICFDVTDNTLWILDAGSSNPNPRVVHCDLNGNALSVINIKELPNPPPKPEALLVDKAKGLMWLGSDETGKIYKYKLNI